ncbi:MAG: hypothetical protein ACK559_03345, partial [bacterium]
GPPPPPHPRAARVKSRAARDADGRRLADGTERPGGSWPLSARRYLPPAFTAAASPSARTDRSPSRP